MSYCGSQTFVKRHAEVREASVLRCRAWTCDDCAPCRRAQLIAQAHRGQANTFITLTCRKVEGLSPEEAAARLANAWRIIHKRALREAARNPDKVPFPGGEWPDDRYGVKPGFPIPRQVRLHDDRLEYLVVVEAHVSGMPHLHILCRSAWIGQQWLSMQMLDLLDSPVVFVQRVSARSQVNAYIAKYCGKCAHKFGNTKRYWESKGYQLTKYEKKSKTVFPWQETYLEPTNIHVIASWWESKGWQCTWESAFHLTAQPPQKEGGYAAL